MSVRLHRRFRSMSLARPAMPGTELEICILGGVLNRHGGDGKWLMLWQCSSPAGKKVERPLALRKKLQQF